MVFSPFDYNESDRNRRDYVEGRLREGSPIVGISCQSGMLLLTVRQSQRKVFEVYDKLMLAAIGQQGDVEAVRIGSINFAHQEGFDRSPDDVTAQRLVGFQLSPAIKRLFGEQFSAPSVLRAVFGELGDSPDDDSFFVLNYDGDFTTWRHTAAIGGSEEAEHAMRDALKEHTADVDLNGALALGLKAWGAGSLAGVPRSHDDERDDDDDRKLEVPEQAKPNDAQQAHLKTELAVGTLEVGFLDRSTGGERRFRLLGPVDLDSVTADYKV